MCFCKIENFHNAEINERSFSNPHPWTGVYKKIALLIINKRIENDGDVRWSPIAEMYDTFCWYDMKNVLISCIQNNECDIDDGTKKVFKKAVRKHEFECWVNTFFVPSSMSHSLFWMQEISTFLTFEWNHWKLY